MERVGSCPFLRPMRQPMGEHTHVCEAGVNFYSVGPGQALCRTCPVPKLASEPICEHLVVYTYVRTSGGRSRYVEASLDCELMPVQSAVFERCHQCPLFRSRMEYPLVIDSLSASSCL